MPVLTHQTTPHIRVLTPNLSCYNITSVLVYLPDRKKMQNYTCFNCKKQGHFARDCPSKTPKKSPPSVPGGLASSSLLDHPVIQCYCDRACLVYVSKTDLNPGRKFYTCPVLDAGKCKFFKWCDEVKTPDIKFSPGMAFPKCDCGAGICRKYKETEGPNAGRSYFVCPIKKGHGACNFLQWENTQADTIVNGHEAESKGYGSPQSACDSHGIFDIANNDLQKSGDLNLEQTGWQVDNPSSITMPIFSAQDDVLLIENQESGRKLDILSANQYDPSPFASFADESSFLDSAKGNLVLQEAESWDSTVKKTAVVQLMSQFVIPRRQMEFWRQISASVDISNRDIIYQSLGLYMLGWLGRLAFPPSRGLTDRPPAPFFCAIFPSFNPICIPQFGDRLHSKGTTTLSNCLSNSDHDKLSRSVPEKHLKLSNGNLQNTSDLKRSSTMMDETGTRRIINFFEQTALIVNQLSTVLNSIDQSDHNSVTRGASEVFSLLNGMSVDNNPNNGCLKEFVDAALKFDAIEQSVCSEHSRDELFELYNEEKVQFDNISKVHEKTVADFMDSSKHLQSLNEEASCIRNKLAQIENQLSSCEAKTSELKNHVDVIYRDMLGSKRRMEKAEEALKLCEKREEERRAAKAALEKIRWSKKQVCKFQLRKKRKLELLQ